ncbi:UPF0280 family protein [Syntrophomonas erecta]
MEKGAFRYVERDYRRWHEGRNLRYFQVKIKETDLNIGVDHKSYNNHLEEICRQEVIKLRADLQAYMSIHPGFKEALFPVTLLPGASPIVKSMAEAACAAGVGPMAAVAGAIAERVGTKLLSAPVEEVIVENGGDIYIHAKDTRVVAVFAGDSPFSYRIGVRVMARETPLGICTSSGTVGHSLSFGQADAVVVKGFPVALADTVATRAGNLINDESDLMKAVDLAKTIPGITGILAIKGEKMAVWGKMEIVPFPRR